MIWLPSCKPGCSVWISAILRRWMAGVNQPDISMVEALMDEQNTEHQPDGRCRQQQCCRLESSCGMNPYPVQPARQDTSTYTAGVYS